MPPSVQAHWECLGNSGIQDVPIAGQSSSLCRQVESEEDIFQLLGLPYREAHERRA